MRQASPPPRRQAGRSVQAARSDQQSPVVVLAYAQAGAALLQRMLSGTGDLACTMGTGLLPLCEQAAATWRQVENRPAATLSPLALASIRALTGVMITAILSLAGRSRWCEIAFSPPSAADTFLEIYPSARFLCLHRNCADVIRSGVQANPWGLAGTALARFATAYPGSSAAAIAAYWGSCTEPLLQFEESHPGQCRRVRHEDLMSRPGEEAAQICSFLGLTSGNDSGIPAWMDRDGEPAPEEFLPANLVGSSSLSSQIPGALMDHVNSLQARIGYPPLT